MFFSIWLSFCQHLLILDSSQEKKSVEAQLCFQIDYTLYSFQLSQFFQFRSKLRPIRHILLHGTSVNHSVLSFIEFLSPFALWTTDKRVSR